MEEIAQTDVDLDIFGYLSGNIHSSLFQSAGKLQQLILSKYYIYSHLYIYIYNKKNFAREKALA